MAAETACEVKAFIVADTDGGRQHLSMLASEAGARPFAFESGEALLGALDAGEPGTPLVVLIDAGAAPAEGPRLAQAILDRAGRRALRLLLIAEGTAQREAAALAARDGRVECVSGPAMPETLRARLRGLVETLEARHAVLAAQAQRDAAQAALHDAYAELESFSYAVIHDLRNPLHAVDGLARLLLEEPVVRETAGTRELAEGVTTAAARMALILDKLAQLAHVGRMPGAHVELDLSALARDIAAELQHEAPERDVDWQIQSGIGAEGDPELVRIALTHLLGNAWKFTGRRARATIVFEARDEDGRTVYCVRDNGAGFDAAMVGERLFKPFRRFHSPRDFPGTGIGLAAVQRIVQRHGGRVWAEARPDAGAAFFFTLKGNLSWRPS